MATPYYESDITRFLRDLVEDHPEIEDSRREGIGLFWNRTVDMETLRREEESEVAWKGYPYDPTQVEPKIARLRHG